MGSTTMEKTAKSKLILPEAPSFEEAQTEILTTTELITPAQAQIYLETRRANRHPSRSLIDRYARDMQSGNWQEGLRDPIRFNREGQLMDGQHRLRAVIVSGRAVQFTVLRNVPDEWMFKIDQGRSRTVAQVLAMDGYRNAQLLAASMRWLAMVKQGGVGRAYIYRPTPTEIEQLLAKHPGMSASVTRILGSIAVRPSLLAAVHYIGSNLLDKPELADAFADVFRTGAPYYPEGDPARVWRESLLRQKLSRRKLAETAVYYGMIHVWNHFAAGTPLKVIKIPEHTTIKGLDTDKI